MQKNISWTTQQEVVTGLLQITAHRRVNRQFPLDTCDVQDMNTTVEVKCPSFATTGRFMLVAALYSAPDD